MGIQLGYLLKRIFINNMNAILELSILAALAMAQPENRFCPFKCVGEQGTISDGSCAPDVLGCACSSNFVKCCDGTCAPDMLGCPAACQEDRWDCDYKCHGEKGTISDGSCAPDVRFCPCSSNFVKCWDGTCAPDLKGCPSN